MWNRVNHLNLPVVCLFSTDLNTHLTSLQVILPTPEATLDSFQSTIVALKSRYSFFVLMKPMLFKLGKFLGLQCLSFQWHDEPKDRKQLKSIVL